MKITNVKTLQDRLKYARELRGLSQKQLAERSKCAQSAIGNVESGERQTLRNLVDVARALEVSADWLYDGKGPQPFPIPLKKNLLVYTTTAARPLNLVESAEGIYDIKLHEPWPFEMFTQKQWISLPEKYRHEFENTIFGAITRHSKQHSA